MGKAKKKMSIYTEPVSGGKRRRLEKIRHIGKSVVMNYLGVLPNKKCDNLFPLQYKNITVQWLMAGVSSTEK